MNIIGNEKVRRRILQSFKESVAHHAWLISGIKGIGKASAIYELIQNFLPDLKIENNMTISANPNLLVISSDFKERKTINIAEIRKIKDFFGLTCSNDLPRFLLIDGAEHMTNSAANALLKILEEPPVNCYIFLISHNDESLLQTIKSRCISAKFSPLSLVEAQEIIKNLGYEASNEILELAENSPALAKSLIDSKLNETYDQAIDFMSKKPQSSEIYGFIDSIIKKTNKSEIRNLILILQGALVNLVRKNHANIEVYTENMKILNDTENFSLDLKQNLYLYFHNIFTHLK